MAVLYRKYRSQTFGELIGQTHIVQTLKNQIALGQIAHAYLFTGSRGVGKTSVARIFAKAVNCLSNQPSLSALSVGHLPPSGENNNVQASPGALGDACGHCDVCKAVENGNFIDLIEIDAASNTGVDNVRDIIEHVKFAPSLGKYKVFIIDEVHMLSKGAFNALLKTLEEPPKHAVFILATTEIAKVPVTIVSRTQRFDFKRLSDAEVKKQINVVLNGEGRELEDAVVALLIQNSEGSLRDALSLLGKVLSLGSEANLKNTQELLGITDIVSCQNLLELIAGSSAEKIPDFFAQLMETGTDFSTYNKDFLEYLRKVLIYKITGNEKLIALADNYFENFKAVCQAFKTPQDVIYITRLFIKSYKEITTSPSPEIPLLLAGIEGALRQKTIKPSLPKSGGGALQKEPENQTENQKLPAKTESAMGLQNQVSNMENFETIDFSELEINWPKVIAKIKNINSPLANTLRSGQLLSVVQNRIIFGVKFLFHKQNLDNQKNQAVILEAIASVFGKNLGFATEVIKNEAKEDSNLSLADALKIFGGEVIE
jgi:DNA polymerase-3 subunit gamma/tau